MDTSVVESLVVSEEKRMLPRIYNSDKANDKKLDELVGEATSNPDKDPTCCENFTRRDLKHFDKFVTTTSTHGVRRIFMGTSKIRRCFWLFLFLVASGICLNNCIRQIQFLAGWPTRQSVTEKRRDSLPFPAVTVCNINPLRKSVTDRLNITDYLECSFDPYNPAQSTLSKTGDHTRKCKNNYSTAIMNHTIFEVFKTGSQDPSRFIVDCGWYGSDMQSGCSYKNFTRLLTKKGLCYTFNGVDNPLHVSGPGQRYGFDMTLNIEREEYLPGTPTAGVFVTIHHQSEPPQPFQSGLAVPPGSHAFISLNYKTRQFLGPPYGTCQDDADELEFFSMYNVPTCEQDHLFTRVVESCKCIDPVAPAPLRKYLGYPNCTINDLSCVLQEFVENKVHSNKNEKCHESCSNVLFPSRLSFGSFPTKAVEAKLRSKYNASDIHRNFLHVSIYYQDLFENKLSQEIAYDCFLLIADIGGQLSLFLGVSVLSFTEFIVWVLDEIKDRLLCFKVVCSKLSNWRQTLQQSGIK